jgi:hypothetical protein
MRVPSTRALIDLWDTGYGRDHTTRALLMLDLAWATPVDRTGAELTIGERDRLLIELRREIFGPQIEAVEQCSSCGEMLEIMFDLSPLLAAEPNDPSEPLFLEIEGYRMTVRAPTSQDLLNAIASGNPEKAYARLFEHCVLQLSHESVDTRNQPIPDDVRISIARAIAMHDALAEVTFDMACVECGSSWQAVFDIVEFLWGEIAALARRTMRDVHILARAYGWPEYDILSLSRLRREHYLGMVTDG